MIFGTVLSTWGGFTEDCNVWLHFHRIIFVTFCTLPWLALTFHVNYCCVICVQKLCRLCFVDPSNIFYPHCVPSHLPAGRLLLGHLREKRQFQKNETLRKWYVRGNKEAMKDNKCISIRSFISLNNKVIYRTKFVARLNSLYSKIGVISESVLGA